MELLLDTVRRRLGEEVNTQRNPAANMWLKKYLDCHNYWISQDAAKFMCQQLKVKFENPGYYKDIKIWLPEIQWGIQLCCVNCQQSHTLGNQGFDHKAQRDL
jgi:hypothetical protein